MRVRMTLMSRVSSDPSSKMPAPRAPVPGDRRVLDRDVRVLAPHLDAGPADAADVDALEADVVRAGGDADRPLGAAAAVDREVGDAHAAAAHGHQRPAAGRRREHGPRPGADQARAPSHLEVRDDVAPGGEADDHVPVRELSQHAAERCRRGGQRRGLLLRRDAHAHRLRGFATAEAVDGLYAQPVPAGGQLRGVDVELERRGRVGPEGPAVEQEGDGDDPLTVPACARAERLDAGEAARPGVGDAGCRAGPLGRHGGADPARLGGSAQRLAALGVDRRHDQARDAQREYRHHPYASPPHDA